MKCEGMKVDAIIRAKLKEIEQREQVRIIWAVEAGSRAWGFSSPNSDYDVRFIYVRDPKEYLRLEEIRDSIDAQQDDLLDMEGWDLRRVLRLVYRSTPEVHEWFASPTIYRSTPEGLELQKILPEYFSVKKCARNYLHTASLDFRTYFRDDEVWQIKYFYLLRQMLLANWLLEEGSMPPMLFEELVKRKLDEQWKDYILELIQEKRATSELGKAQRNKKLIDYIEQSISRMDEDVSALKDEEKKSWEMLNQYFYSVLKK